MKIPSRITLSAYFRALAMYAECGGWPQRFKFKGRVDLSFAAQEAVRQIFGPWALSYRAKVSEEQAVLMLFLAAEVIVHP